MKKHFVTLALCVVALLSHAQGNTPHAIGIRLGAGNTFGSQVSYQYKLSNYNRLEIDFGFNSANDGNGFILSGAYQWLWDIESGFNWYAGPAVSLGSWNYDNDYDGKGDSGAYFGLGGQIGIEYNFVEVPINLSLDTMPQFGFGPTNHNFNMGLSISARYKF
ncbi:MULTISPECIES: hypothetical protein [unclassified Carboxylicivirga]|uniref:hypothetical protein n=1 Tax=Carboxylicivirga TaxID=1628153 RepID=UPI003D351892